MPKGGYAIIEGEAPVEELVDDTKVVRRRRLMTVDEAHPIKTFVEQEGQEQDQDPIGKEIENIRIRELRRLSQEEQLSELDLIMAQRQEKIKKIKAATLGEIGQEQQSQGFTPQTDTGRSFMNDPETAKMVAGLPQEKQQAFFQSMAQSELMLKNPTMAIMMQLLGTYQKMSPQQAQQTDPAAVLNQVLAINEKLDARKDNDPIYKAMRQQAEANMLRQFQQPEQPKYSIPPPPENSLSAIIEKKIADRVASISVDELFGGPKQAATPALPIATPGVELYLDEITGQYMPKKVTYDQYLDITKMRNERLQELDKAEQDTNRMKMITDKIVEPILTRAAPLIDSLIAKGTDAIQNAQAPTLQKTVTAPPQQQPQPRVQPVQPELTTTPPEEQANEPTFIACKCGQQIPVTPDLTTGEWPKFAICPKCNTRYDDNADADNNNTPTQG